MDKRLSLDKIVPTVVQDYSQEGMDHVDTYDAALSRFQHYKNTSWRRAHFLTMLKFSIVNAWVMYCQMLKKRGDLKKSTKLSLNCFMHMLQEELASAHLSELKRKKEEKADKKRKWTKEHMRKKREEEKNTKRARHEGVF